MIAKHFKLNGRISDFSSQATRASDSKGFEVDLLVTRQCLEDIERISFQKRLLERKYEESSKESLFRWIQSSEKLFWDVQSGNVDKLNEVSTTS